MRTIGVVTVGRSDWSACLPVLTEIRRRTGLRARLFVTGAHLSTTFGHTVDQIVADGFTPDVQLPMLEDDDTPLGVDLSSSAGTAAFGRVFATDPPDILLVYGDRFEMHAAALAALPFTLPVAHICGGDLTEGAIDDSLRHSITKLSHLHFVANEVAASRVRQLGEESWRVHVTGDPLVDHLEHVVASGLLERADVARRFGLDVDGRNLLVTYHPVTLQYGNTVAHINALLNALTRVNAHVLFTYPNPDTAGRTIIAAIEAFADERSGRARVVVNAGRTEYVSILSHVDAMVGNSSSGLVEAPRFELPAVNVGIRQRGRVRGANVIDCGDGVEEIHEAIGCALAPETRRALKGMTNPYGDPHAAQRIVDRLESVVLDDTLLIKRFVDLGR